MAHPLWKSVGPGLLWAGTAIGVSHLVQSTRAGAGYGLTLMAVVLVANAMKYPAYETGPRYTAATGRSLLEGYHRLGPWALPLFGMLTVSTMFTVIAAVTFVAAGMASALIADLGTGVWGAILLSTAVAMLAVGKFKVLERFMTVMMLVLTLSTVASVVVAIPKTDFTSLPVWPPLPSLEKSHLLFVAALVGWMPSALDTAVWHSLWGLEKQRTDGVKLTPAGARLDFNIGYIGTAVLAALFVFLGASVLYGSETEIPTRSVGFATVLIDSYTAALGAWARPLLLVAAFSTMLSTTIAVTDGFPRALEGAVLQWRGRTSATRTWVYWGALGLSAVVAELIILFFLGKLTVLVDLATGLTGLTAPLFAVLNFVVVTGDDVPAALRPGAAYKAFHLLGILFLFGMAGLYFYARFVL